MLIDTHNHLFPDELAPRIIPKMVAAAHVPNNTDGTRGGLLSAMDQDGVDCGVVLPIVTAPKQFDHIFRFGAETNEMYADNLRTAPDGRRLQRLSSFASIHPDNENLKEKMQQIAAAGFKGIKLHPDYQNTFFNDIRYKRIVSLAAELDLIVAVHAGIDIGLPDPIHATPAMSLEVLRQTEHPKVILAHLGGWKQWDEVEALLVGQQVYMDMAFITDYIEKEQFVRMVKAHGSERILFATDSPWSTAAGTKEWLDGCGLSDKELENICWRNAMGLLT